MPTWVDKSFALVGDGGYLDKLVEIYPPLPPRPRHLPDAQLRVVREALAQPDDSALLRALLELKRFPFNHPYVSFLRATPGELDNNPVAVGAICRQARDMGVNRVVDALHRPKELNRQMGAMFRGWLKRRYAFVRDRLAFHAAKEPLIFLDGSGEALRRFANEIGCGIQKQPDFVAKARERYVVGEAKWIGTEGGNQNRAFDDALGLASSSFPRAVTAAVLDGII